MKKIILIISVVLQFNVTQAWQEFHGGDPTELEVSMIAHKLISDMENIPALEWTGSYLLEAWLNAEIISTDSELILNGQKKIAVVSKTRTESETITKLEININLWDKLTESEKEILVLHEMLNLTTLTDEDYFKSNWYHSKILLFRKITQTNNMTITEFIFSGFDKCSIENLKTVYPLIITEKYIAKMRSKFNASSEKYCQSVTTYFKTRFDETQY